VPSGAVFSFGPFHLDTRSRRLLRGPEPVTLSDRNIAVLTALVANAGTVVAKDALIEAAWQDAAVGDNSLEQAISSLRRALGKQDDGASYIQTLPRRGYRFTAPVRKSAARVDDAALEALLAPHRAFIRGGADLETLGADAVAQARTVFESIVHSAPDYAPAHVGLANAIALGFEATRADLAPDAGMLQHALHHAREACRLDPAFAEAWAALGLVLLQAGENVDAIAAAQRAVSLDADNWRHHLRLAYVSWGEERLRAAHRTLALLPGHGLAHWLAATVHVARQAFEAVHRELAHGAAAEESRGEQGRFGAVGLYWLTGLMRLARGDEDGAMQAFERELSFERSGHLYARESCASTWYAIGAVRLRATNVAGAHAAFEEALRLVPGHLLATVARTMLAGGSAASPPVEQALNSSRLRRGGVEVALALAVDAALHGDDTRAAHLVGAALTDAAPGPGGWIVPVEPMLQVTAHPEAWAAVLATLRSRAA
jgi:DNA-binding winged helix-turn-helix (wHTH) protein/cytochrome c-type biogenesis protein CcmH/NrfG